MEEKLVLTQEWDKSFPQSDKVEHSKVTFHNRYGITLAADIYKPKDAEGRLAAIAVCGPFGAVKEQAAGLYAQTMAERGFLTMAFDPSFTGESGGHPRSLNSNGGWNVTGTMSFMNQPILRYSSEIRSAVLIIHGEKAHSCYFSRDAYAAMTEGNPNPENKELLIIPGAVHTDLYDKLDVIPFDKMADFFRKAMRQQE